MGQDDKIRNPVEEYMQYIVDRDKPEKPVETTAGPAKHLEVKKSPENSADTNANEALKIADAIRQSVQIKRNYPQAGPDRVIDTEEDKEFDIRRHPVGLVMIFLSVIVTFAATFSLVSFLLPGIADLIGAELSLIGPIVGICMIIASILGAVFLFFAARGYLSNRMILTSLNIAYTLQTGLRSIKTGELSLDDIKDVKVRKTGVISRLFNYGTMMIETTDGENNLMFIYTPDPDVQAKLVHDYKLEYLARHKIFSL